MAIARKHGLWVIEDCAQAHLARYKGRQVGTFGAAATYSFYPGKNLGAMGDAGAIVTDRADLAERMAMLARHGGLVKHQHHIEGINSRLDGLQAAILSAKLPHLPQWTKARQDAAKVYDAGLNQIEDVVVPSVAAEREHVYHLYTIQHPRRDTGGASECQRRSDRDQLSGRAAVSGGLPPAGSSPRAVSERPPPSGSDFVAADVRGDHARAAEDRDRSHSRLRFVMIGAADIGPSHCKYLMKSGSQLLANSTWNAAAFLVGVGLNLIVLPFVVVRVGVASFGIAGLVTACIAPALIFSGSLALMITRELAQRLGSEQRSEAKRFFATALFLSLAAGVPIAMVFLWRGRPWRGAYSI